MADDADRRLTAALAVLPSLYRLLFALVVGGVLRIARALILRVRRISAQRAAASGERASGGIHRIRRGALFHPVRDGGQHVEGIERSGTAAAVAHAGRKEKPAPVLHFRRPAVGLRHPLVVADRVLGGEPRIADAVIEDQLAAVRRERAEIRPVRGVADLRRDVGAGRGGLRIHVLIHGGVRWSDRARAGREQPRDSSARGGDPGVEEEARVHLVPLRVLRSRKPFLMASACSAERQPSALGPLHTSEAGSKLQPRASKIMPSLIPSRASQTSRSLLTMAFRSPSESAPPGTGLPSGPLGAILFKATVTVRSARFDRPVRMAGAPATTPSKYIGYRSVMIIASRPPVEQPT